MARSVAEFVEHYGSTTLPRLTDSGPVSQKQAEALLAAYHATTPMDRFYAVHEYVGDAHICGRTYQWWRRILDNRALVLIGPFK